MEGLVRADELGPGHKLVVGDAKDADLLKSLLADCDGFVEVPAWWSGTVRPATLSVVVFVPADLRKIPALLK